MTATALATLPKKPRARPIPPADVIYPDSDGKPMADNTRQFDYIVMIEGGLAAMFADPVQSGRNRPRAVSPGWAAL